jgi:hypothetical protein
MEGVSAVAMANTATATADLSVMGVPVRFDVGSDKEEEVFIVIAS